MSKSRFVFDKFAKVLEQGLVSYKDLSDEIINILKSKRDEIIFRMKLASKEEVEILNKRISILEKKQPKSHKIHPRRCARGHLGEARKWAPRCSHCRSAPKMWLPCLRCRKRIFLQHLSSDLIVPNTSASSTTDGCNTIVHYCIL